MILLWGIQSDDPLIRVRDALRRAGAAIAFLDQQAVLESRIELEFDGELRGSIRTPDWTKDVRSIAAVYLRPYDARRLAALRNLKPNSNPVRQAFAFEDAVTCWLELTPALVVNRPSAMASNNSKPFQSGLIRAAGFATPDTLITTDPAAVIEFQELRRHVIYKSISGVRSIVTRLGAEHAGRLGDVAHCPTQFQHYVSGNDVRIHVVGEEVFGCEIRSGADDYRYPDRQNAEVRVRPFDVPDDLAARCRALSASLNLPFVGIDLRHTDAGEWCCFEANPSPGFTFYEEAAGQGIAEAVTRLLMGHLLSG